MYFIEVFVNKYASTYDKEKGIFRLFSVDSGAVRIWLSSDKECTYVCFRGIKKAAPIINIGIRPQLYANVPFLFHHLVQV